MIACIRIPYFATTVYQMVQPKMAQKPFILAQYKGRKGTVYATSEEAVQAGVAAGMSLSRARAICPEAVVEMASLGQTRRAVDKLLVLLSDFSQWVEAKRGAQMAVVYVDIGRLLPQDGVKMGHQMIDRLLAEGLKASVGLASGKFTGAVAAATTKTSEVTLVKKGMEAAFLAPLSSAFLPLDKETARRFELLGLRRMGQVEMLPRAALLEQFGKLGAQVHQLASGEDQRRVAKYAAPNHKQVSRQFEPPLSDRLILESILASLVSEISQQLLSEGMTCSDILLSLHLDNHSEQETEKRLCEPLSSSSPLYRMVQPLLDTLKITAPITQVSVRVGKLAPIQPRQLSLFDAPQTEALEGVLIQLADRYGETCFYRVETHRHRSGLPELQYHLTLVEAA